MTPPLVLLIKHLIIGQKRHIFTAGDIDVALVDLDGMMAVCIVNVKPVIVDQIPGMP